MSAWIGRTASDLEAPDYLKQIDKTIFPIPAGGRFYWSARVLERSQRLEAGHINTLGVISAISQYRKSGFGAKNGPKLYCEMPVSGAKFNVQPSVTEKRPIDGTAIDTHYRGT